MRWILSKWTWFRVSRSNYQALLSLIWVLLCPALWLISSGLIQCDLILFSLTKEISCLKSYLYRTTCKAASLSTLVAIFLSLYNGCCRVTNSLYRKMMSLFFNPTSKTLISSVLISAGETEHQRWVEPAQRCFTRRRCATLYALETQPRKVLTWSKGCNILDAPQLVTHFITATQKVPLKPWCSGMCKTFYLAKVTV